MCIAVPLPPVRFTCYNKMLCCVQGVGRMASADSWSQGSPARLCLQEAGGDDPVRPQAAGSSTSTQLVPDTLHDDTGKSHLGNRQALFMTGTREIHQHTQCTSCYHTMSAAVNGTGHILSARWPASLPTTCKLMPCSPLSVCVLQTELKTLDLCRG